MTSLDGAPLIYLVMGGDGYDDIGVELAFADEADADACVAMGYGNDVMEVEIKPAGWRPTKRTLWSAYASVAKTEPYDEQLQVTSRVFWDQDVEVGNLDDLIAREVVIKNHANRNKTELRCSSFDQERAVKIVSDAVAKLKAEREGL